MKILLFSLLALVALVAGLALLVEFLRTGSAARMRSRLKCLVTKRGKTAALFFFVVLWYAYPTLADMATEDGLRPALMDVGVFQTILLAAIRGLILFSVAKLFLKHELSIVHRFLTRGSRFVRNFLQLTPWQKHLLTAIYLFGFLFLFAQLTR